MTTSTVLTGAVSSLCLVFVRSQDGFNLLLRRHGGSKRNSLLRWCQSQTQGYKVILDMFTCVSELGDILMVYLLIQCYLV